LKILFIATRIPSPLTDGGQICLFNTIKYLALRGHRITLLTYGSDRFSDLKPLHEVCDLRLVNKSTKDSLLGGFLNLFSDVPYKISKYISEDLCTELIRTLQSDRFDIVHVEQLHVAQYGQLCRQLSNLPIVLREENVESVIVERFVKNHDIPIIRAYLRNQLDRTRKYEARMAENFDLCCMITDVDRKKLEQLNGNAKTCVVTAGVDSSCFQEQLVVKRKPRSICFFGSLYWIPNRDGVLWFLKDIFPRILRRYPDVIFYIIGKDAPSYIKSYQGENVVIRGFIPDLQQELAQYEVTIVPIRIGGGIRIKILESFAMRIPIVTTSIGCEGIEGRHMEHLLIGNTPEEFADHVVKLLSDANLRHNIAQNAYVLADKKYRWEQIAGEFEKIYEETILNHGKNR
jgi:glycosyltransferase involved in cell wall biosynthesis